MLQDTHRTQMVRQYCAHILDREVFAKVRFLDKKQRDIVYASYIENLDSMIEYAIVNKLCIGRYFKEIKNILLQSEHVHERTY